MNKEEFLRSLSTPVDDYRALRKMEAQTAKSQEPWSALVEEGQLAVDVYETADLVVITASVAGVKPDDLDVSVTGDTVTIRGKREAEHAEHHRTYFYRECFFGSFSRSIVLPVHIVADRAEATIKNGLLTVRIPKATNEAKVPIIEAE